MKRPATARRSRQQAPGMQHFHERVLNQRAMAHQVGNDNADPQPGFFFQRLPGPGGDRAEFCALIAQAEPHGACRRGEVVNALQPAALFFQHVEQHLLLRRQFIEPREQQLTGRVQLASAEAVAHDIQHARAFQPVLFFADGHEVFRPLAKGLRIVRAGVVMFVERQPPVVDQPPGFSGCGGRGANLQQGFAFGRAADHLLPKNLFLGGAEERGQGIVTLAELVPAAIDPGRPKLHVGALPDRTAEVTKMVLGCPAPGARQSFIRDEQRSARAESIEQRNRCSEMRSG